HRYRQAPQGRGRQIQSLSGNGAGRARHLDVPERRAHRLVQGSRWQYAECDAVLTGLKACTTRRESIGAADALPDFVVERREALAAHDARRDVVGELFGLQKRKVREDPHMPELVRDRGAELGRAEVLSKTFLDRE